MPEQTAGQPFGEWCVLELMGHRRLAGYVQEVQLAGAGFLRLDIPAAGDDPGRTQFIAPGSVYALHPVSEETARRAAGAWRPAPVQRWELPAAPPSREDVDGFIGWLTKSAAVERAEFERERQRDEEWDAQHGVRRG